VTQWQELRRLARAQPGPILIYGPTASGKSELALRLAETLGGVIINADASQVWSNWQHLTARPGREDLRRAPHRLYGHLPFHAEYSTGRWLREAGQLLQAPPQDLRPIIIGGTGLYFKALTEGMIEIPETPKAVRRAAEARIAERGHDSLVEDLDHLTRSRIDLANPRRVQRAWEVLHATGQGLAAWQDSTPAPILTLGACLPIHVVAPRDWLTPRLEMRFEQMLANGALEEARANLPFWSPRLLSMKPIGARELIAYLDGTLSLRAAQDAAVIATRQYAKRQRTWGRARMAAWIPWHAPTAFD